MENIQKIINNNSKSKPKLNMIIKDLSKKQIIVSINNENKSKFIEASSVYITSLNKAMKNIKLEVMADFIHSEQAGIIIIISKVASLLDL